MEGRKRQGSWVGGWEEEREREKVSGGDHRVTIRTWIKEMVPGQH